MSRFRKSLALLLLAALPWGGASAGCIGPVEPGASAQAPSHEHAEAHRHHDAIQTGAHSLHATETTESATTCCDDCAGLCLAHCSALVAGTPPGTAARDAGTLAFDGGRHVVDDSPPSAVYRPPILSEQL